MSYCINPRCTARENRPESNFCSSCGTPLLLQGRYRLLQPLRELDEWEPTAIFEVADLGPDPASPHSASPRPNRVLKVLKNPILLPQFEREAHTLQQLNHPGIPTVHPEDYFSIQLKDSQSLHCLVMENIQGSDLAAWLEEHGPISQSTAQDWMRQLIELLAQLHAEQLFHRDIKLSNIMRRPTAELALIDFGTVRPLSHTYFAKVASQRDITSVMSPGYTPLEQVNGRAVPQSDFYALGRSFVHLLTGEHPLDLHEDSVSGKLTWQDKLPQPVAPWFSQLLDDMMAPFPGQRPLNADILLTRLKHGSSTSPLARSSLAPSSESAGDSATSLSNAALSNANIPKLSPTPSPTSKGSAHQNSPLSPGSSPQDRLQHRLLMGANLILLLLQLYLGWHWFQDHQAAPSIAPTAPSILPSPSP